MKKNTLAVFFGTLILFGWQSLSWMVLPVHSDTLKYAPQQSEIMESLRKNIPAAGAYRMPGTDPSADLSFEDMETQSKEHAGKPWALIFYNTSFEGMSAGTMMGGVLLNLAAVVLAVLLFHAAGAGNRSFAAAFGLIMVLPAFCILQPVLQNMNWWSFPWHFMKGEIIDLVIGWSLCGAFLTWYLKKQYKLNHEATKI